MSIYVEDIFKNILLMVEAVKSVWRIWVVSLILAIRLVFVSEAPNIYVSWIISRISLLSVFETCGLTYMF